MKRDHTATENTPRQWQDTLTNAVCAFAISAMFILVFLE